MLRARRCTSGVFISALLLLLSQCLHEDVGTRGPRGGSMRCDSRSEPIKKRLMPTRVRRQHGAALLVRAARVFHDIYGVYIHALTPSSYSSSNFCFALANSASVRWPSSRSAESAWSRETKSGAATGVLRGSSSISIASAASRPPEPKRGALATRRRRRALDHQLRSLFIISRANEPSRKLFTSVQSTAGRNSSELRCRGCYQMRSCD